VLAVRQSVGSRATAQQDTYGAPKRLSGGMPVAIYEQQTTSPYIGRRMTLDAFLTLPEQEPALEYYDGVMTQKVAPQPVHVSIQPFLWDALNRIGRAKRIGLAFTETRFVTERWAPVPDVVFYLRGRIRRRGERDIEEFREPPDIVIEVVSRARGSRLLWFDEHFDRLTFLLDSERLCRVVQAELVRHQAAAVHLPTRHQVERSPEVGRVPGPRAE
jgi:hypothetical protein